MGGTEEFRAESIAAITEEKFQTLISKMESRCFSFRTIPFSLFKDTEVQLGSKK